MKKFTLITLLAVITIGYSASAQIQQGNVLMGGDIANLNIGLNASKPFSVQLTPKAAWFVQDNVALGGYVNLGLATAKSSPTTFTYGVGGLARYYTGSDAPILKHSRLFGEATIGIGGVDVSNGGGNTNGLDFSFGPGYAYFITPNLGLETLLKFNGVAGFGSQTFQSNLNLSFGFQIYLPGKSTASKVKRDVK